MLFRNSQTPLNIFEVIEDFQGADCEEEKTAKFHLRIIFALSVGLTLIYIFRFSFSVNRNSSQSRSLLSSINIISSALAAMQGNGLCATICALVTIQKITLSDVWMIFPFYTN